MATDLRLELKYPTGTPDPEAVTARILGLPWGFQAIHGERTVHSLYFDTRERRHFQDHAASLGTREKVRLRWYSSGDGGTGGDSGGLPEMPTGIDQVALEVKARRGAMTLKSVTAAAPGTRTPLITGLARASSLELVGLWGPAGLRLVDLVPVAHIIYRRRYFAGPAGIRLTVDFGLRIAGPDDCAIPMALDDQVICELKAPPPALATCQHIGAALGWSRSAYSKYMRGLRMLAR